MVKGLFFMGLFAWSRYGEISLSAGPSFQTTRLQLYERKIGIKEKDGRKGWSARSIPFHISLHLLNIIQYGAM
jgi:hypothetical protein